MSVNIRKTEIEPSAQGRAGRWWALAALVISGLVIGLDSTVLITALPTLSSKLGASTSDLQWIAAAYTLTLGGLLLPGGVLGSKSITRASRLCTCTRELRGSKRTCWPTRRRSNKRASRHAD